jgi:hypothetical protein
MFQLTEESSSHFFKFSFKSVEVQVKIRACFTMLLLKLETVLLVDLKLSSHYSSPFKFLVSSDLHSSNSSSVIEGLTVFERGK